LPFITSHVDTEKHRIGDALERILIEPNDITIPINGPFPVPL
jgi:hypothetical protein